MFKNNLRLTLIALFCGTALLHAIWNGGSVSIDRAWALEDAAPNQASMLEIGGKAPEIDIADWISDGNGFFKPPTTLQDGRVYVIEFWATWCGPCIASMPHLAELQNKYRGRGVQLISVSDESVETVNEFLKREAELPDGSKTTFAAITSAYCLTTDPDRSVHQAYMDAAQQQGIPTAFIVGKTGVVEWIGHPMDLDEPLEKVVENGWDRVEFAKLFNAERRFDAKLQEISTLAGTGKPDDALKVVDQELATDLPAEIRQRWIEIRHRVKLSAGIIDNEVTSFFKSELERNRGNAVGVARIGWSLYQVAREQDGLEELLQAAIKALSDEIEAADEESKPLALDTLAHLYETVSNLDAAIETQRRAVDAATGRTSQRLERYLKELEEQKSEPEKAPTPSDLK